MSQHDLRIARVQKTLRWFEEDVPLLELRIRELSKERQESAKQFAAALIDQARAELDRLLREQPQDVAETHRQNCEDPPCEPAD
jgi:hypothetical protein